MIFAAIKLSLLWSIYKYQFAVIILQFDVIILQFVVINSQFAVVDLQNISPLCNDLRPNNILGSKELQVDFNVDLYPN